MRFLRGELIVCTRISSAVWNDTFSEGVDVIQNDELILVVESTNREGWTQVMTPRGIQGYIHKTNVCRPVGAKSPVNEVY